MIDPDENLQEQREIINELQCIRFASNPDTSTLAFRLAELVDSLDDYLSETEDNDDLPLDWYRIEDEE
jgi:hypothetical protein